MTDELNQDEASPTPDAAVEKPAYTGRPADKPTGNSTFAERAAANKAPAAKAVQAAENKAVKKTDNK